MFHLFVRSFLIVGLLGTFSPQAANADSTRIRPETTGTVPSERISTELPPVVPGQRVFAGGQNHKIISTAGPVSVTAPPPAQVVAAPDPSTASPGQSLGRQKLSVGSVDVILDNRNSGRGSIDGNDHANISHPKGSP